MKEKIRLSGVPETMLQTVYARAKESRGRGAFTMQKRKKSSRNWTTIFPLRTRIRPCAAASLPEPSCSTG